MKKIVCLLAGVFACFQLFSQGVDFKSVSLKEALEQAKLKGKWYLWIATRLGVVHVK